MSKENKPQNNTTNKMKVRVKKTGETVTVGLSGSIGLGREPVYQDANGNKYLGNEIEYLWKENERIDPNEGGMPKQYWRNSRTIAEVEKEELAWEQRRYEAAKDYLLTLLQKNGRCGSSRVGEAIAFADSLIKGLRGEDDE